ncbi:zinc finger protein 84-like [Planococcus citri]|uniref:zinc finger protein 84-like n=1 Tax=Planococcus citri TaxID=170843 RepID=UPI0031F90ECA
MNVTASLSNLCRLCLEADQANIPIFKENEAGACELFDKISTCLPVKLTEDDRLPKNICSTCHNSVDFVYNFWQISSNTEKQLKSMVENAERISNDYEVQECSIDASPENTLILYETLEDKDAIEERDDEEIPDSSNIEIKEVYFGEYLNQCDTIEDENTVLINEESPKTKPSTLASEILLTNVSEDAATQSNNVEDIQISQIVESSNVSLREWMSKNEDTDMSAEKFLDMILVKAEPKPDNNPYSCVICGEDCVNEEKLIEHARVQHKSHKCPFCNKIFAHKYVLENHLYVHTDKRKHPCSQCALSFKREVDLLNHVKRTHARSEVILYRCDKCDYTSKNRFGIKVHILAHDGISIYNCDECGKGFSSKAGLRTHKNNHMGIKPFQCDICGNSFTRGPYLKQHRQMVHENPHSFKCDICYRGFSLKSTLKNHLKLHTGENKILTCDMCGKTVSSRNALINHQRIHTGDKRFSCNICGKAYVTKLQVKRHAYVHTGEKPFSCNICQKKLATGSSLLQHMQTHWENRASYSCNICHKQYISKYKLRSHISTSHQEKILESDSCTIEQIESAFLRNDLVKCIHEKNIPLKNEPKDIDNSEYELEDFKNSYNCHLCYKVFQKEDQLNEHLTKMHRCFKCPICQKSFGRAANLRYHMNVHKEFKDVKCEKCGSFFKSVSDVRTHMKRVHADPKTMVQLRCSHCEYVTPYYSRLKKHMLRHSNTYLHYCEECGKGFNHSLDLQTHINNHKGVKPYQCEICGKNFNRESYMKRHRESVHVQPFSYECAYCQKRFSFKYSLKSHIKVHQGIITQYPCDYCPKKLSTKLSLRNHIRLHNDERPFKCDICDKRYTTNGELKSHSFSHVNEKPFRCEKCPKTFRAAFMLKNHMTIHATSREQIKCSFCEKMYYRENSLKKHVQKHHKTEATDRHMVSENVTLPT